MALLTCSELSLGYERRVIVSGLSFTVEQGDYLCIVGENGSGKSTLMKTVLGLKAPMGGRIVFGEGLKKKGIGYLPQQTPVQKDFPASAEEIVRSGFDGKCGLRPFYTKEEKRLADAAMEKMNILPLRKRCFRELSGGQQQRVLLARAFCAAGRLLLLDEPVSGLDPDAAEEMYRQIGVLHREGTAVIMISHDLQGVKRFATHVLRLGKEPFFGTAAEYDAFCTGKRNGREGIL